MEQLIENRLAADTGPGLDRDNVKDVRIVPERELVDSAPRQRDRLLNG